MNYFHLLWTFFHSLMNQLPFQRNGWFMRLLLSLHAFKKKKKKRQPRSRPIKITKKKIHACCSIHWYYSQWRIQEKEKGGSKVWKQRAARHFWKTPTHCPNKICQLIIKSVSKKGTDILLACISTNFFTCELFLADSTQVAMCTVTSKIAHSANKSL